VKKLLKVYMTQTPLFILAYVLMVGVNGMPPVLVMNAEFSAFLNGADMWA
jgi:hypothetical protein